MRFSQIIATANFTPFTQTAFWPLESCFGRIVVCLKILASVAASVDFLFLGIGDIMIVKFPTTLSFGFLD